MKVAYQDGDYIRIYRNYNKITPGQAYGPLMRDPSHPDMLFFLNDSDEQVGAYLYELEEDPLIEKVDLETET